MTTTKILSEELESIECAHMDLKRSYTEGLVHQANRVAEALQQLIVDSKGLLEIRWRQGVDYWMDDNKFFRDIEIKFNPDMFPTNEEEADPLRDSDDYVADYNWDEFVESGMDVINLHELTTVEEEVELVKRAADLLHNMEKGLKLAFGDMKRVSVTSTGIKVSPL